MNQRRSSPDPIEQVLAAMRAADIETRATLPALPRGFEWQSEVIVGSSGAESMTAHLRYTVRAIPGTILNPLPPND